MAQWEKINNIRRTVLLGLTTLFLFGCTSKPIIQDLDLTLTPSYQPSEILSNTPTRTSTSTDTPIPIDFVEIDTLIPGQYLVYFSGNPNHSSSPDEIFLSLARPDGEDVGILAQVGTTNVSISPDLKWITELPEILDTTTGTVTTFEELIECRDAPSWAPDSLHFVASCMKDNEVNLYVFSVGDRSMLQITDFGEDFSGSLPAWSPDGKWIAYTKRSSRSGISEQNGLHIIDAECFSSPFTCTDANIGMGVSQPYVWSPDSKYLAAEGFDEIVDTNSIDIFSVTNGNLFLYKRYPITEDFDWISWAPSQTIAIDASKATLLLSVETGEYSEIKKFIFLSWIEVH
jgi:WD40 repeat protein